jgi:hypothetical protein
MNLATIEKNETLFYFGCVSINLSSNSSFKERFFFFFMIVLSIVVITFNNWEIKMFPTLKWIEEEYPTSIRFFTFVQIETS